MAHSNTRQVFLEADHKTLDQTFGAKVAVTPKMTQNEIMYRAGIDHVIDTLKKDWTKWS